MTIFLLITGGILAPVVLIAYLAERLADRKMGKR